MAIKEYRIGEAVLRTDPREDAKTILTKVEALRAIRRTRTQAPDTIFQEPFSFRSKECAADVVRELIVSDSIDGISVHPGRDGAGLIVLVEYKRWDWEPPPWDIP